MRRVTILLFLLLSNAVGCGGGADERDADTDVVEIPFRTDATLAIMRSGQELATLNVEIADDDSSRARGMMQRSSFPDENSGMLFIFEREQPQSFWMSNTPLSLDLMFADADSMIVDIDRYARPFSPEQITSDAPARFVLEVPAGFADSYGITEGDRLEWDY